MRAHVYTAGTGKAVTQEELGEETRVSDVVTVGASERVFLVGNDTEIDVQVTLREISVEETAHVLVHHCENVELDVSYAGRDLDEKTHITTLVSKILAKTAKTLGISDADAADLAFRIPGTNVELEATAPIGSYVPQGSCSLALDLVHLVRSAG
jgi:hypothetical protein